MAARPSGGEQRRNAILDGAQEVFTKMGIGKARMDDIARQSGLSKGTLYLYFENKEGLVTAILERLFSGAFRRLENYTSTETTAEQTVMSFTEDAIRGYLGMLRMTPVVFEFLSLAFRNKTVQKAMRSYLKVYMKNLVPIIERGVETKEFREVDAQEIAIAIAAILEGTVLLWAYDRTLIDVQRHIRSSIRALLDGVRSPA